MTDRTSAERTIGVAVAASKADDTRTRLLRADMDVLIDSIPLFGPASAVPDRMSQVFRPPGFGSLVQLILEQQVSVQAAKAMWQRLTALIDPVTPQQLLELDDVALRQCGFSGQKMRYARGLAAAVVEGAIDLEGLDDHDDEAVMRLLTALKGLGPWTAQCYLLFALGRRDVLPAGDLALLAGWQWLAGLTERPASRDLVRAAEAWRPRRSAASLLLWRVYLACQAGDAVCVPGAGITLRETLTEAKPRS